ncbi:Ig-like domain-containing protein, partial [Candidatus Regiella insecticola]|uniref:Ig-like domain-containing protein n=1 Tax=Candidatus Regiella insecticola TaxID=138073 RepID=UPI0015963F94
AFLDDRPLVTVPVGHDGTWSHELKKGEITKSGQYNFQAKVVDIADNKEESFILEVEVDLSVEIDAITLVDNTGQDKTENFTNVKNPKFAITVQSDVIKMEVSLDNGDTWQTIDKPVVNKPNGKAQIVWNYQIPTDPVLAQETYTLLVKVLDKAGNKNTKSQNFTIDTEINAPAITLDPASYSKGENQDNLTNITQPKFNLTGIDSDITTLIVTVKNQDKNTLETITITRTMTGLPQDPQPGDWKIEVRDANGTLVKGAQPELKQQKIGSDWQLSLKQPLKDGKHTLSIQTKDRAGNDSEKLSDDKKSPALELKIDTVLSIPTLTLDTESDTGIQQDNITKNTQPAFNLGGIDDDITDISIKVTDSSGKTIETVIATRTVIPKTSGWTIKVVGTDGNEVVSHQAGFNQKGKDWQLTLNQALDDGHYQLSIETEDRAGNKSSELHENDPSSLLSLEIDSNISVPEIRLDSESDTGDSKSDNITNITEPTFNLTGIDPDVIKITLKITSDNNKDETLTATRESTGNPAKPGVWSIHPAGSAVLKENNDHWQITLKNPLKQGMHQLSIENEDRAGNKSSETHRNPPEPLTLHIDTELSTPLTCLG